mmetsp:Transcript_25486/g.75072  ORF Transcript_25486/g.75072 Transcript_25486/m.75072 type:complete len:224 (-) Transcript_25486:1473-2144(-)
MGFSAVQAKTALASTGYDVQSAIDSLLAGPPAKGGGGGGGVSAPPPGFSRPKENPSSAAGVSKKKTEKDDKAKKAAAVAAFDASPPPGHQHALSGGKKNVPADAASPKRGGGGISGVVVSSGGKVRKSLTPPRNRGKDGSEGGVKEPKRSFPPEVTEFLKKGEGQSRLSMVVLGHVDAGKSTLMGQLLLQLGHVEKRTVAKYEKQAAELGKASFALAWVMVSL